MRWQFLVSNPPVRALAFLVVLPLVVGAGAAERDRPNAASDLQPRSARFAQATTYLVDGQPQLDSLEGAFDWAEKRGWAELRYANATISWRQVDGKCFERVSGEGWQKVATDPDGNCGLAPMQNDPTRTFALIRRLAGVEKLGEADIDGVKTTHYRATWREPEKGPLELWVDGADVVRRVQYGGRDTAVTTVDYFDFGVKVDFERPKPAQSREDASR